MHTLKTSHGPPYMSHSLVTISMWFCHRIEHLCTVYDCHHNYFPYLNCRDCSCFYLEWSYSVKEEEEEQDTMITEWYIDNVKGSNLFMSPMIWRTCLLHVTGLNTSLLFLFTSIWHVQCSVCVMVEWSEQKVGGWGGHYDHRIMGIEGSYFQ